MGGRQNYWKLIGYCIGKAEICGGICPIVFIIVFESPGVP